MSTINRKAIPFCFGLLIMASTGSAQSLSVYTGVGTATDGSSHQQIDTFGNGVNFTTPKLTGLFEDFGATFMVTPHFGANVNLSWRFNQGNYAGLNYRPLFYDFNGVWVPVHTRFFVPEVQAGIGGVHTGFSVNQQSCDQFVGCINSNTPVESSTHFQGHFGVAARVYLARNVFLRPAVDAHYVNNFFQFGSNWVPEYTIGVGFTFGQR